MFLDLLLIIIDQRLLPSVFMMVQSSLLPVIFLITAKAQRCTATSDLDSVLALTPNPWPILVKDERHGHQRHADTGQDRESVCWSQILVEWHTNNDHASRDNVSYDGDEYQCTRCKALVCIDDVLVACDEYLLSH